MRVGEVRLTHKALIDLLHLPSTTRILEVQQNSMDRFNQEFRVIFSGPECPEVYANQDIPWVNCTIRTEFCNSEERLHIVEGHITP